MAKCKHCGKHGLFLKLTDGLCQNCYSTALMEKEQAEIKAKAEKDLAELNEKAERLKYQIADNEALYEKIKTEAKTDALKEAETERADILEKNRTLNLQIAASQEKLSASQEQETKLQKQVATVTRKLQRGRELVKAIQHVQDQYDSGARPSHIEGVLSETEDFLQPTVQLDPQCLDMRELRKWYRQNEKAIQDCLEKYKSRYTTKANIAIYRLMCIAMAAALQHILLNMRFGKLEEALASVAKMTDKYLQIAAVGIQIIAPTVKRFVGEIDYYYQESVKIEYEYYVKKELAKDEQ